MQSHTRHVTPPMVTSSRYGDSAPIIDGEEGMCGRCMNPAAPPGAPSAGKLRPWLAPYPFAETGRCTERVSTRPPCPGATEELCVQNPKAGACGAERWVAAKAAEAAEQLNPVSLSSYGRRVPPEARLPNPHYNTYNPQTT